MTFDDLTATLTRIDGKGYKAYKDIVGMYHGGAVTLIVDHVQGDPFGAPSRFRIRVPQTSAGFPEEMHANCSREIAFRDHLTRTFARHAHTYSASRGSGGSGIISIDTPGQEILDRTAVVLTEGHIEVRFVAGLPAHGRTIRGRQAIEMLTDIFPHIARESLFADRYDTDALWTHITTAEDADTLRDRLADAGYIAFVANDSILPRESGVHEKPMREGAIPFSAPEAHAVTFSLPHAGEITGMGIPAGVNLIVGGGYHGKTTLLEALERGVYTHIPGDGREYVVTDPRAVKIRAEDGRAITGVDITPFITNLPHGAPTDTFSSENASGSTSQAANIMEALEAGATTLLIDEDTSATNFMIRDERMQELVAKDREPITPFIDKVRSLFTDHGVSTILVIGGSGDYFEYADTVIAMDEYTPRDVTDAAHRIAHAHTAQRQAEGGERFGDITPRAIDLSGVGDPNDRPPKIKVPDVYTIIIGKHVRIDLSAVAQCVDASQTRAIAQAIISVAQTHAGRTILLPDLLDRIERTITEHGIDGMSKQPTGDHAIFRRFECAAAIDRLRVLHATPSSR